MKRKMMSFLLAIAMVATMTACGNTSTVETTREEQTTTSVKEETTTTQTTETEVQEPVAQEPETQEPETQTSSGPVEFSIATVGGMYFDDAIVSACGEVGYDYLFEDVKDYISDADVAIGVIQTPLKGIMDFYDLTQSLANAGFDAIDVATVNCLDESDVEGLNVTMGGLFTSGIATFGATTNANPRDKIAYVDVKGVKVAFIAGAQNIAPEAETADVNSLDLEVMVGQIDEAKKNGAAVIVVSLNYPDKEENYVSTSERFLAEKLAAAGADFIICSGFQNVFFGENVMFVDEKPACGYIPSQGAFVSSTQVATMVTRINVVIGEDGKITAYDNRNGGLPIYIDSSDHYKLVPLTAADVEGDYPDEVKALIESMVSIYDVK